jgi:hypothetical protein
LRGKTCQESRQEAAHFIRGSSERFEKREVREGTKVEVKFMFCPENKGRKANV